jgi:DNA-binding response OmpR family regulator
LYRANGLSKNSWAEGAKVLIVDSDTRNVHELALALRMEGYVAFEATSFADAKRLWMSESPHVLVADVCLGQFNGLQLLMQAREENPDLNAVITCAFADVVLEAEARRFGGVFLVKPLEPRQILAAIGLPRGAPVTTQAASLPERRERDRRKVMNGEFAHDRRARERRSSSTYANHRGEDRRRLVIPDFSPDRRIGERRGAEGMSSVD